MERPLAARPHDARVDEALEVMAERRGRHVHVRLDRPGGGSFRPGLHHVAQDRQANRVPERPELLGVAIQLSAHDTTSKLVEVDLQARLKGVVFALERMLAAQRKVELHHLPAVAREPAARHDRQRDHVHPVGLRLKDDGRCELTPAGGRGYDDRGDLRV